jgi:23S rRNA (cytosine1962-C5)-methyltransferase
VEILVSAPCIIHEDDHLLVVNKPAGINTHAPGPYAGEGIYDWLRHREPRWASLAIVHRLDKETSGVLVFSKTEQANRSLTEQFTRRAVHKKYVLLTDRPVRRKEFAAVSALVRTGEKYVVRPIHSGGELAETRFRIRRAHAGRTWVAAEPVTGRTHQIRAHAADHGFPILGDTLYGGTPAPRVHLHAEELSLKHPATSEETTFGAPADFFADPRLALRLNLIDSQETNAYRLVHGASDGWPGWYVDRCGDFLLSQSGGELNGAQREKLADLMKLLSLHGAYHYILARQVRTTGCAQASPRPVLGSEAPEAFGVLENGVRFALSFCEGQSVGLFLDQRDNRRRLLTGHIAAGFALGRTVEADPSTAPVPLLGGVRGGLVGGTNVSRSEVGSIQIAPSSSLAGREVLNTFAYTCGFSVCAAKAGARVTSLDLSKKYLEWGRRNFALNGLNAAEHDFIYGDVFDWLGRLARKGRAFDVIVLDPPTFSRSKEHGAFQVGKDYGQLVSAALPLLRPDGALFASTNAGTMTPEKFLEQITAAIGRARRTLLQQHYAPQPSDFPVSRAEPAYLKTVWLQIG